MSAQTVVLVSPVQMTGHSAIFRPIIHQLNIL